MHITEAWPNNVRSAVYRHTIWTVPAHMHRKDWGIRYSTLLLQEWAGGEP